MRPLTDTPHLVLLGVVLLAGAPDAALAIQCQVHIETTGVNGSGDPYARVAYSVSLPGGSPGGGYGIAKRLGPDPATPSGACNGSIPGGGSASGTCTWTFTSTGVVQFGLTAGGGTENCSIETETVSLPESTPTPPTARPTPVPTSLPRPRPSQTTSPTPTVTPLPTNVPTPHACTLAVLAGTGGDGAPYVDLSYTVTLASPGALGGYGLEQTEGPAGSPVPGACTPGGFITGSTSGTCRWGLFAPPAIGVVTFQLTSSGPGTNCTRTATTAIGGARPTPRPTSRPTVTPTSTPRPTPSPATHSCSLSASTGQNSDGTPYVSLAYSVDLRHPAAQGGYGIQQTAGPAGAPIPGQCAPGGSFTGSTSGTCRWGGFAPPASGPVEFTLSSSGGLPGGPGTTCSQSATAVIGNPTPRPRVTPGPDPFARVDVMSYNVNFLPSGAVCPCYAPLCPLLERNCSEQRAPLIARHPLLANRDAIAFQELFHDDARARFRVALRGQYPYQTAVVDGPVPGPIHFSNGGVAIFSKWPLLREDQHVYTVCNDVVDCAAAKGVKYARIARPDGKILHVYATHTDADLYDDHEQDARARLFQLLQMEQFISTTIGPTRGDTDVLLLAGDFNIDMNPADRAEYLQMLAVLQATPPSTQGGSTNSRGNWLDYVLNARAANPSLLAPTEALLESFYYAWDNEVPQTYDEYPQLSDHYPVLGSFVFAGAVSGMAAPIGATGGLEPSGRDPAAASLPLASPVALTPSGVLATDLPTLQWTAVPGATLYDLQVVEESSGKDLVAVSVPELRFRLSTPLVPGNSYRWSVTARGLDDDSQGPASPEQVFVFQDSPLASPIPVSPVDTVPERYATFTWTEVPDAEGYRVEILEDGDATQPTRLFDEVLPPTETFVLTHPLAKEGRYHWRVTARRGSQWSAPAEASFDVASAGMEVAAPIPLGPEGASSACAPVFAWKPAEGAEAYEVTVTEEGTENLAARFESAATGATPPMLLTPGRGYRWFVRAVREGIRGIPSYSLRFGCDQASSPAATD